jgi:outer membrane protein assembly factor BamD (BamD/ComL family)
MRRLRLALPGFLVLSAVLLWAQNAADVLYDRAQAEFDQRRYSSAYSAYDELLRLDAASARVSEYLAMKALSGAYAAAASPIGEGQETDQSPYDRALRDLRLSTLRPPLSSYARQYPYWKSEIELLAGRDQQALDTLGIWLDGASAPAPDDEIFSRAWQRRFELEESVLGAGAAADHLAAALERAWAAGVSHASLDLLLAEAQISLRRYADAASALQPRLDSHADDPRYRRLAFLLAESYYLSGLDPGRAESGYLALLSGEDELALASYLRLFDLYRDRGDQAVLLEFARRAQRDLAGRPEVLREFYQRIVVDAFARRDIPLTVQYLNRLGAIQAEDRGFIAPYYQVLLIADGEPQEAIDLIDGYYAEGGQVHPWLEFLRAEQLYRLERYGEAADVLDRLAGGDLFEPTANNLDASLIAQSRILRGYCEYARGNQELALEYLESIDFPAAVSLRSRIHGERGRYALALRELETLLGTPSWNRDRDIQYLQYLLGARQFSRLQSYFGQLSRPRDEERYVYALSLIQTGQIEAGYELLNALVSGVANPSALANRVELYYYSQYYLGWTAYRLSRDAQAVRAYRTLLDSGFAVELHDRAAYEGTWSAIQAGDYTAALEFIEILEELRDRSGEGSYAVEAAYLKGKVLRLLGRTGEAARQFADFQRDNPRHPQADDALYDYGRLLIADGEIERGIRALEEIATAYPDSNIAPIAAITRARALFDAGEYLRSRTAFTRYRQTYPSAGDLDAALYFSALASRELGEAGAAQLYLRGILDDYADGYYAQSARYELATLLDERGGYSQALGYYREYLTGTVSDATRRQILTRIGELERIVGGEDAQAARLWNALESDRSLSTQPARSALAELGTLIIVSRGGISERLNELVGLLDLMAGMATEHPRDAARARYLIGRYRLQLAEYRLAATSFLNAAAADPRSADMAAESLYFALEAYQALGSAANARAILDQLEASYPDSPWTAQARDVVSTGAQTGGNR